MGKWTKEGRRSVASAAAIGVTGTSGVLTKHHSHGVAGIPGAKNAGALPALAVDNHLIRKETQPRRPQRRALRPNKHPIHGGLDQINAQLGAGAPGERFQPIIQRTEVLAEVQLA